MKADVRAGATTDYDLGLGRILRGRFGKAYRRCTLRDFVAAVTRVLSPPMMSKYPWAHIALAAGALSACTQGTLRAPALDPSYSAAASEQLFAGDAPSLRAEADADYHVGTGDVLDIRFVGVEELNRTVRVRSDGTISLPLVGALSVESYTTLDLERVLVETYVRARLLRDPQTSVFVREYRAHPVAVLGQVNRPGLYHLRGPSTLVEVLGMAGGLTPEAGGTVHLRRGALKSAPPGDVIEVDLSGLLTADRPGIPVVRNDTVYVPRRSLWVWD